MDFKQAKLDNQDIIKESTTGIYYVIKEWRRLATSDDTRNIDGVHGRSASPTYARYRVITLEGYIDRIGSDNEQEDVEYLQNLFMLQSDLGELEVRELYIRDMYDQEWLINVKVKDPLDIIEGDDEFRGSHWKWRVVLESTDTPVYKGFELNEVTGVEGTYGGFKLPHAMNIPWNNSDSFLEVEGLGNTSSFARFEVTVKNTIESPFRILNVTKNRVFELDITAEEGDIIIVDGESSLATKNGTSVLANRIAGSVFPAVQGNTKFVVKDADGGIISDDFDVKILYRNALL